MESGLEEQQVPSAILTGINFNILTEADAEKLSVIKIDAVSEVTDPKLGVPNPLSECSSCGGKDVKNCEGHYGLIRFPVTVLHPYYITEVVQLLNKICPACKSVRQKHKIKGQYSESKSQTKGCKYCWGNPTVWYPTMKFKISSNDLFRKTAIMVELNEKLPKRFGDKNLTNLLPVDYWDFIPKDPQMEESCLKLSKRVLSHAQVHSLLNGVNRNLIKELVQKMDSFFLNCFLVTPNWHRVMEVTYALSNGHQLMFDERTKACRKLVDYRGTANELGSRVMDCLNLSKLHSEKSSTKDAAFKVSSSKWLKDTILGKRSDHSFRMVVAGDPKVRLSEIGIPCYVAERMQISETINSWNFEKLKVFCTLRLLEKGEVYVRRKGDLIRVHKLAEFKIGDTIYRPLNDGDIILVNRPPSIHQHSLIALFAKILPINSVLSLNPLCCSPFRGDFDGDCLHGYIPQSYDCRIELKELVSLNKQLINGQNGRNLLSLTHDSLTAAHLVMEDEVLLNRFHMQQLAMFSLRQLECPAIVKGTSFSTCFWTGKQLFSMLLPPDFDYVFPSNDVHIRKGNLLTSPTASSWLRDTDGNLFSSFVEHSQSFALDFLHAAQDVLCEWLSMRGFSVSLCDLYLTSDVSASKNMADEIHSGLQEAEWTCHVMQLMVDSCLHFLAGRQEENETIDFDVEQLCYEKQKSPALSQASINSFKQVFRDIQNLIYQYASKDNSMLAMVRAGSKGSLLKVVQQSMCLGLQHSLVPLSFRIPRLLSCNAWNHQKFHETSGVSESFIPYAAIGNSFLNGLNPLECFVHSVTNRDISFSDGAEVPGTLNRKLMFFMRDLYIAYDGTVRNAYGNHLVQFCYNIPEEKATACDGVYGYSGENRCDRETVSGEPVGSLAACAISEAAYSALDQPISFFEKSPLLNLKNVLECGSTKSTVGQTVSLYLSKKLQRHRHGFEYGALEVKSHLERLLFSEIVSTVMIHFSPQTCSRKTRQSCWICHFHVRKETVMMKGLNVHCVVDALYMNYNLARAGSKLNLPNLQISCEDCTVVGMRNEDNNLSCITITFESSKNSCLELDTVRDLVIPFLLGIVIKGFSEILKVDILWKDHPGVSKCLRSLSGELYLKVYMSSSERRKMWNTLVNFCVPIMNIIDWTRSHPDNINAMSSAYGIDAAWRLFLMSLKSSISDIGKKILPKHLVLAANCLSSTGEFVSLSSKGMAWRTELTSVSAPFMQACFSNASLCFVKAAKAGVCDDLQGNVDALAWGKAPSIGTGGQFGIIYSEKGHELAEPVDIHAKLLGIRCEQNVKIKVPNVRQDAVKKFDIPPKYTLNGCTFRGLKNMEVFSKALRSFISLDDIHRLSQKLKIILHKYPINQPLGERDHSTLMVALYFHPRRDEKIGSGAHEIKVGNHPDHTNTRCFLLRRTDGSVEDFSYHKCILGALEIIAPQRVRNYQSKWLKFCTA